MEPFIGQIQAFGFNFAPRGWAQCNGQLLSIGTYQALFSLLGTQYGGDGKTTFGLPDLRGRVPIHEGQGPGLSNRTIGQRGGEEQVTLTSAQMPNHSHSVNCVTSPGNVSSPQNAIPAAETAAGADVWSNASSDAQMSGSLVSATGGTQGHDNMQPYLTLNWCIALEGIYPSKT